MAEHEHEGNVTWSQVGRIIFILFVWLGFIWIGYDSPPEQVSYGVGMVSGFFASILSIVIWKGMK